MRAIIQDSQTDPFFPNCYIQTDMLPSSALAQAARAWRGVSCLGLNQRTNPRDPKPLPLNYRHEEETGLYFAGDYNLRGRTPKADVDVCFNATSPSPR
jgi:hypothetical protein